MSTPAENADTQQPDTEVENQETGDKTAKSFADVVKETVRDMKQDDKGNWVLPEGLSEEAQYAIMAEKRLRDTQASFTQVSQKAKALEAEKAALRKKVLANVQVELTKEQQEELEDLKFEDPEAWRKKMNAYEQEAIDKYNKELEEEEQQVSASTLEKHELEQREQQLASFLEDHPGFELNDDIIKKDIPPRITDKLANGKISFEQFLHECHDYLNTSKVVGDEKAPNMPNLGKYGGGDRPDDNAVKEDIITSYKSETY